MDRLFQLPEISLLLKFRFRICEMELLVPPVLGFRGMLQKLLSAFLLPIVPWHFLSFLGKKLAYLEQQVPTLILTFSQYAYTGAGKWDLGRVVPQVSRVIFGFLEKGGIFPTSFCFACRSIAWSCGNHFASMRTKLRRTEHTTMLKDSMLPSSNGTK